MRLRFDGGTLRIEDIPERLDPRELPGVVWDPRVAAHRAAGCCYRAILDRIRAQRLPVEDRVCPLLPPPDRWREVHLRPYQAAALAAWESAGRRGVVVLPTGAGKTRLALAAMARFRRRALVLVPTRVMLTQWREEIAAFYPGEVGIVGDGSRTTAPVTVITFESAGRRMPDLGNRFDLLIVDEVHHLGSTLRSEALELSIAEARLGLSATPPEGEDRCRTLERLVGPFLYELTVADLTGEFLAPFDLLTIRVSFAPADRLAYRRDREIFLPYLSTFFAGSPEATWDEFCREAVRSETGREALSAWRRARNLAGFHRGKAEVIRALLDRHRDVQTLVFTASNEAAYAIARANLIMPITCDIRRPERLEALRRFAAGELRALVSAQVLNEGIDVPDAEVAIIAGGTGAEREHVQRVGRLLRPGPGKRATVYELVTRNTAEVNRAARLQRVLRRGRPRGPSAASTSRLATDRRPDSFFLRA